MEHQNMHTVLMICYVGDLQEFIKGRPLGISHDKMLKENQKLVLYSKQIHKRQARSKLDIIINIKQNQISRIICSFLN